MSVPSQVTEPSILAAVPTQEMIIIFTWDVIETLGPQLESTAYWWDEPSSVPFSVVVAGHHLQAAEASTKKHDSNGCRILLGFIRLFPGLARLSKHPADGSRIIRHNGLEVYKPVGHGGIADC